jgi:hypothetical protein
MTIRPFQEVATKLAKTDAHDNDSWLLMLLAVIIVARREVGEEELKVCEIASWSCKDYYRSGDAGVVVLVGKGGWATLES